MDIAEGPTSVQDFWEDFYRGPRPRGPQAGTPSELVVAELAGLDAGTALDLGCGQGGDAIWLAARGWQVTAVDVSTVALERAAAFAAAAGVPDTIRWERHDLAVSFPAGTFDLVSACSLHSPVELPRDQILRAAAAAVAPGGSLLVVGHARGPSWSPEAAHAEFPTLEEVLQDLALPPSGWAVRRSDVVTREVRGPEGQAGTRADNVLRVERLADA